jgi:hypothetical protein
LFRALACATCDRVKAHGLLLLAAATACGGSKSETASAEAGASDGSSGDASHDAAPIDALSASDAEGSEAGADAGDGASTFRLNSCGDSNFAEASNDYRGKAATIYTGDVYAGEFAPYCMLINVGQSITFEVDTSSGAPKTFVEYPLQPFGGDPGNPITATTDTETSVSFVFGTAGNFGFEDPKFASMTSLATGAVRVVP